MEGELPLTKREWGERGTEGREFQSEGTEWAKALSQVGVWSIRGIERWLAEGER